MNLTFSLTRAWENAEARYLNDDLADIEAEYSIALETALRNAESAKTCLTCEKAHVCDDYSDDIHGDAHASCWAWNEKFE